MMFTVQQLSRPNESGTRQVQLVDAEWDYGTNDRLSWERVFSFIPNWASHIWVRKDTFGVIVEYGR